MKHYYSLVLLLLLHTAFIFLNVYSISHVDSAMHLLGGVALAMLVSGFLTQAVGNGWCPDTGRLITLVLVISLVATGAVCWEVYEWVSDRFLGTHFQVDLDDTMKDLVLGLLGGAGYAVLGFFTNVEAGQGQRGRSIQSGG
jgi:hypothetical protein